MLIFLNLLVGDPDAYINDILKKIRNGDTLLRDKFINDYTPFIVKSISHVTGKYVEIENSDEYSVGLMAFNEAIDCYDESRNASFFTFTRQVIKRRVIDCLRKKQKDSNVFPFTYMDKDDDDTFEEKYLKSDSSDYDNIETREEIELFEQRLREFGITLENLVMSSPRHTDSKQLAIKTAQIIANDEVLFEKLDNKKVLPMSELEKVANVSRRTIERNRKFIIAVCLILRSDMDVIKGYVRSLEEGGQSL